MQISVRQARLLKGMTQAEMAEGLKVHVQTYRKIEKNANLATIEQAKKISALTGVPYNEIFLSNSLLLVGGIMKGSGREMDFEKAYTPKEVATQLRVCLQRMIQNR